LSRASRRFHRTLALGLVAMAALVWAAVDQFDISRGEVTGLLLSTLLAALVIIAMAGVFAAVWVGIRRVLRKDR